MGASIPPVRLLDPDRQPMHADAADEAGDGGTRRRSPNALGVAELAFCFGFPYADFADCGPALAAYADTQAKADAAADAFAAHVAARESSFRPGHVAGGRSRGGGEAPCGAARRSRS